MDVHTVRAKAHKSHRKTIAHLQRRWRMGEPITTGEVAELFGMCRQTVWRRRRNVAPVGQVGRRHYYTPAQVRAACFGGVQ